MVVNPTASAISALTANRKAVEASAGNVANVLNDDYRPVRPAFQSEKDGGVDVAMKHADSRNEGGEGVQLEQEAINSIANTTAYKANLTTIRTADRMVGHLLDVTA